MVEEDVTESDCGGCAIRAVVARREFLRHAGIALAALGVLASRARALPVTFVRGDGGGADKAYALPAGDGVAIDKDESVIIARVDKKVYAFSLACPHQNTAIRWEAGDHRFQCPKHKSRYRPDGTFIEGRATRGLDRFAVRGEGDRVMVNLDLLYREDENRAEWTSAFLDLAQREK